MMAAAQTSQRIVIVGGGVAGLSVAVRVAQSGLPVTLVEASELGLESSTRNQGWLYSGAWFAPTQPDLARMCYESLQQTIQFCPDALEPQHDSMAFIISKPDTRCSTWTKAWNQAGIPYEEMPLSELFDKVPGLARESVQHAYRLPDRAIRNDILLQQLAATAENFGAEIRTETAVTELVIEDGTTQGVVTGSGEQIPARMVILAGNVGANLLWPQPGEGDVGEQSEFTRVALKAHLIAVKPDLSRWPFCIVDANGFNHIPHAPTSVFGMDDWQVVSNPRDLQVDPSIINQLWHWIEHFFPEFRREEHEVAEWAGTTVQAMHVEQIEPGRSPFPTVIDHQSDAPRIENLLSVFPGRATLWSHLAEDTRKVVLSKLDSHVPKTADPPWTQLL